jgi:hypothetical protein
MTTLRLLTMGPPAQTCNETMTCPCEACVLERGARVPADNVPQPWTPRPAKRAA